MAVKKKAEAKNDYDQVHHNRFVKSIEYFGRFVKPGSKILEAGGKSGMTEMLSAYKVDNTETDIRLELKPGKYDAIIATEVIEHLKDLEEKTLDFDKLSTWQYSGLRSFLNLCNTNLAEDGVVFISTPNVATYKCVANLLYGEGPFMYQPHVRELSINEIEKVIHETGYNIVDKTFIDVWNSHGVQDWFKKEVDLLAGKAGAPKVNREDNIFLIIKPV